MGKIIPRRFITTFSQFLSLSCRVGHVNAESLACQRHRKQLEKGNNRWSCHMHGTASDKSKLSKIPITLLSLR